MLKHLLSSILPQLDQFVFECLDTFRGIGLKVAVASSSSFLLFGTGRAALFRKNTSYHSFFGALEALTPSLTIRSFLFRGRGVNDESDCVCCSTTVVRTGGFPDSLVGSYDH